MAKTFSLARFSTEAKGVVAAAQKRADGLKHKRATSLHLLMVLLERIPVVGEALASVSVDPAVARTQAERALGELAVDGDGRSFLSMEMIELLRRAEIEAGAEEVGIGDLLNALAQEAQGPTREVLSALRIRAGAFRSFFVEPDDAPAHEEEGEAMLRDFASEVRGELRDADERALRDRGRAVVSRLADQLSGRDGIPALRVLRENETRIKLERLPRDADIIVEWEGDSGAVAIHRRQTTNRSLTRYLWNRKTKKWLSVEGGNLYADLQAALKECLFPEMR